MIGEITEIFNNKITLLKANNLDFKNVINKYVKIYVNSMCQYVSILTYNKSWCNL